MLNLPASMNVLFVCTGNVCRSPMAQGFLTHEARERGLDLTVRSTGTHAWVGRAATFEGRKVMNELGVPIDDHRTRELDAELLDWADLVLGLSSEHVRDVVRDFPCVFEKTFGLREFVHLLDFAEGPEVVAAAHSVRSSAGLPSAVDIDDPYGDREESYRRTAGEIRLLISEMASRL